MDCEKLINLVHERRSLWDAKHSQYHNRDASRKLWCEIGTLLDATSCSVKKKWQRLKDTHRREVRKSSLPSGSGANNNDSKWRYFEIMNFLNDTYTKRPLVGNISKQNETAIEVSDSENVDEAGLHTDQDGDESVTSVCTDKPEERLKSPKKCSRKRKDLLLDFLQLEKEKVVFLQQKGGTQQRTIEEDEDYFFLMSLLPHLRAIPQEKKLHTRVKLEQVLIEEQAVCNIPPSTVHEGTVAGGSSSCDL